MAGAWRAALILPAFFLAPTQGQGGGGSTLVEDTVKVCTEKFVAGNPYIKSVCDVGYREGKVTGQIAHKSLSAALAFPHQSDDGNSKGNLPALSRDLCEINAEGLSGRAITEFLLRLAKHKPSQLPKEIIFSNLRVNGRFNAPSATIAHKVQFDHVIFCGHVDFSNATMSGILEFTNSIFVAESGEVAEGIFRADGFKSTANILIRKSRLGGIILRSAQVSWIGITESAFGHVSASGVTAQRLAFNNSRQYQLIFDRTKEWLKRMHDANRKRYIKVMGAYPPEFFASNIDLTDLKLGGLFYSDRLVVDGALTAVDAEISTVRLRTAVLPALDFRRLDADRVELFGAVLGSSNNRKSCEIDRAFRYNVDFVSFQGADIGGDFLLSPQPLYNESTGAPLTCAPQAAVTRGLVCLNEMHVAGDLDLSAASADQIDLRRTTVGATLSLASETYETAKFSPSDSFLDMRGMQIGKIFMSSALVLPSRLRMARSSVGGYVFKEDPDANLGDTNSLELLTTSIERIIDKKERALAFQVFETTFRNADQSFAASRVSFLHEFWLTRSMDWGFRRLTRYVPEILGGYGTEPVRTVIAAAIATLIGAAFAFRSTEGRRFLMRQALSHRALRRQSPRFRIWLCMLLIFDALVLSLDRLIPLVSISQPHKDLIFRKQAWVRAYFVLHSILGILLAGTTVATISKAIGLD